MVKASSRKRKRQLGDFVRARREKLTPEGVGLAASGRRRTPGLRREEAAQLCGMSVTWYTWLEQGRDVSVSPAALACLKSVHSPAYLLDRGWNAVGLNEQAERLFVAWLDRPGERNLLRYIFLEPAARTLIRDYDERARRVVAEFRANIGTHIEDAPVRALTEELRARRPCCRAREARAHSTIRRTACSASSR